MKNIMKLSDLLEMEYIVKDLCENNREQVILISTKSIFRNKSAWASTVCSDIYNQQRKLLQTEAYHFSYIKFAINKTGKIFGIVGGKSQFHHKYASDVCFYDIEDEKFDRKRAAIFMRENELNWYEDEILILKNIVHNSSQEAKNNEKMMQNKYNLFG